jgi:hypothetical protein
MKRIIASAAAILLMAGTAGPAFAKGHSQPASAAEAFGQPNADANYIIGGETAAPDANGGNVKGTKTTETGLDGSDQSTAAKKVERPTTTTPE